MMNQKDLYRRIDQLVQDPFVAPLKQYQPALLTKAMWKLRYASAARGVPLTTNERRIALHKDIYRGRRAFLIGNGPSLNQLDLTLLKNEITFGVNGIYLARDKMGYLPTHYIVEDYFVAEDRANEINKLEGTTKWFGNYLRYCLHDGPTTNWLNILVDYRNFADFPHFSEDIQRRVWVGGTVSFIGMQLAFYMGVSELVLIGFDHSYSIPDHVEKTRNDLMSHGDDPNHFHPDYFGKGYRWHDPMIGRMEQAYRKAARHYHQHDRRILNATSGGHLEVFPRVDYASLF